MINFNQKYNRQEFLGFLNSFLPDDFVEDIKENIETERRFQKIKKVHQLGEVESLGTNRPLRIYEVEHTSENDPRVTLTREAFWLLSAEHIRRALIVFVSKNSDNYRFSLMTIDLKDEGRRVKQEYSNPRRYSFYLGPDAKVKTPTDFLIKKGRVEDFEDLLSRFSIEIVTKEFFAKYKKLFEDLSYYLSSDKSFSYFAVKNQLNIEDFAKKLLGQIVFLYFLQRRGWLGAEKGKSIHQGDKNFFRNLFNKKYRDYSNFFNDILEYLFYDALNNKPQKAASFYRDYFNCQIPFLNGGLFEPLNNYDWKNEFLYIPNELFSNKEGTGILDIFDLYNFTVDENLPTEQEVSIDPEMLGKIFENLLEENLRKGKGTYYTPREIVHYMCQESLINYLITESGIKEEKIRKLVTQDPEIDVTKDIVEQIKQKSLPLSEVEVEKLDNLLKDIKVVDPACGSGAFLVGMLQLIVHCRDRLTGYFYLFGKPTNKRSEYDLKRETIQNCIYGVDIDPGAVEIAKLRLWLSLVVDYGLEEIEPLPNLDYKIMQGNSLIEEFAGVNVTENKKEKLKEKIEELENKIEEIEKARKKNQAEFFESFKKYQHQDKKLLKIAKHLTDESKTLQVEYNKLCEELKYYKDDQKQKNLIKKLHKKQNNLFNESNIEAKNKLRREIEDIIIKIFKLRIRTEKDNYVIKLKEIESKASNIPKVQQRVKYIENEKIKLKRQFNFDLDEAEKQLRQYTHSQNRPFFPWRLYFADVFEQKGGFDIVIANPPYEEISNKEDKKIFQKFYSEVLSGHYDLYIFFFKKANDIAKTNGIITFITPHTYLHYPQFKNLRKMLYENNHIIEITNRISNIFESAVVDNAIILLKTEMTEKNNETKFLCKRIKNNVLENYDVTIIKKNNFSFRSFDVQAIQNLKILERFSANTELLGEITESSQGITVYAKVQGEKVNWFRDQIQDKNSKPIIRGRDIQKYLLIWSGQYIQYGDWLWCPRKPRFFEREKIFLRQTSDCLIGTYVKEPMYCIDSVHSIINLENNKNYSLKYILAILNSMFGNYLYQLLISETGKVFAQVKLTFLRKIPIKRITVKQQKPFIDLVDKILALTKTNDYLQNEAKQKKVKEYEKEIDRMVYKLYGLTEKEIKIVENK